MDETTVTVTAANTHHVPYSVDIELQKEMAGDKKPELDWMLYGHGIAPIRRDHQHKDRALWQDTVEGGSVVTRCKLCGDFIGRRPKK